MHFKRTYILAPGDMGYEPVTFRFDGEQRASVAIDRREVPVEGGRTKMGYGCSVEIEMIPPSGVLAVFQDLADNRLPTGVVKRKGIDAELKINSLHLDNMPVGFNAFFMDVYKVLESYAWRTVSVFRWRSGIATPHDPLGVYHNIS